MEKWFFPLWVQICRESYGVVEQKKLIPGGDQVTVCKDNRLVLHHITHPLLIGLKFSMLDPHCIAPNLSAEAVRAVEKRRTRNLFPLP